MKGRPVIYTAEELAWLEGQASLPRRDLLAAFRARFGRPEVTLDNIKALCWRQGWKAASSGRFAKGQEPFNKGKPMPFNPNSAQTRFRKGNLPHNTKWAGHERLTIDGYVEISVERVNPYTGFARRYVLKHRWLWEQANGAVPAGHALKCLDGNKLNCDPSNWTPVPRAMLPRLNGGRRKRLVAYDAAPAELKPAILAAARLHHAVRTARRGSSGGSADG
ncbi:HNH endonuclease [Microcystis phage vB_MweS-yong2]|nr:HNH endonuclease [Microcystis phage vB_MweS-yong2]